MTRGRMWLVIGFIIFIVIALVPFIFGENRRVMGSVCTRCGVVQYHVYQVVWGIWVPNGTATSGGRPGCAHEIRIVQRGPGDLLDR